MAALRARDAQPALRWAECEEEDEREELPATEGAGELQLVAVDAEADCRARGTATAVAASAARAAKRARRERDSATGSAKRALACALHRLHVLQMLSGADARADPAEARSQAMAYVRARLSTSAARGVEGYAREVRSLMGASVWAGRLEQSPYDVDLQMSDENWQQAERLLARLFCAERGMGGAPPLATAVAAGAAALPQLLKLGDVQEARGETCGWAVPLRDGAELPVEVDLPLRFRFRSAFVCPVSREAATRSNPPVLLPCGHVLGKLTVQKLLARSQHSKCPYCPTDFAEMACMELVI